MKMLMLVMSLALLFCGGKAFALGVDVGPVHAHTKGSTEELKVVVDTVVKSDDGGAVTKLYAHRKDGDDKFEIKVVYANLDDETKDLIKAGLKTGAVYKAHLEKLDDDWKLIKLRKSAND